MRLFSPHLLPLWYQVRAQQAVDHVNLELDNHDYSQHHMLGLFHPAECGQTQPRQPTPPHPQNWGLDYLHQTVDQVKQECVYNSTRRPAPSSRIRMWLQLSLWLGVATSLPSLPKKDYEKQGRHSRGLDGEPLRYTRGYEQDSLR